MVNKISRSSRKRKQEEYEDSQSEGEFSVNGLIDGEASESENEDEILENREGDVENNINREQTSGPDELDDDISSEELEKLLEEEEEEEGVSDVNSSDFSDEPKDNSSITDKLSNIRLRNLPQSDDFGYESKYSDGSTRIIKPEIDPVYDSDENDGDVFNTIGNVPLSAYEEMPHIGYDINGKRIMRPAKGSALDQLLESIDLPDGWTGLLDKNSGAALKLSDEELDLIKKIQLQENTDSTMNPYEPTIEWFTSQTEVMPLTAAPEPKRRFVPSKHEAKRVMKIVRAIREGRIIPPSEAKEQIEDELFNYDLWTNESETNDHIMNLRAPKIAPPTNDESYNPPEEYLLTEEELKKREELDPEERDTFVPQKYTAMRKIPGYQNGLRERFERCLDLYLAPRVRHNKLNIDIDSLIPELPSPKDLRPFPIRTSTLYEGHTNKIRTLSVSPSGNWLATGSDDGTIRIWEVLTGRQVYMMTIINKDNKDDHIEALEWNPDTESGILAVAAGENIYLIVPPIFGFDVENEGKSRIESGWGYNKFGNVRGDLQVPDADDDDSKELETGSEQKRKELSKWVTPSSAQAELGVSAIVQCKTNIKTLSWHRKGDYFVTVAPDSKNTAVLIHQMSKHLSQSPFKKSKGIIVDAKFHPFKPQFFVASQRTVKIYDLSQQTLIKRLMPGARLLSSIDIHPRGDNLLASSYDKRVLWHDLDLSATPYKTLRYHEKAVRSIKFHKGSFPLFASASDDGSIHVFHGTVYDDLMSNALLVPLKKLTGHKVINSLGILDLVWHPKEAWLFSAGADGTARLWTT